MMQVGFFSSLSGLSMSATAPPSSTPSNSNSFANVEESMDGGGSLMEGNPKVRGQTWDPPPVPDEPVEAPEVVPPVAEEIDPSIPRLPPNVERAKGGYLIGGRFVRDYKNSRRPPWIWPEI